MGRGRGSTIVAGNGGTKYANSFGANGFLMSYAHTSAFCRVAKIVPKMTRLLGILVLFGQRHRRDRDRIRRLADIDHPGRCREHLRMSPPITVVDLLRCRWANVVNAFG